MLRTIRTARNRLVIKAFKGDTTDPGSITAGWADIANVTRIGNGNARVNYYDAYAREPVVLTTLEGLSGGFADCRVAGMNSFDVSIRDTAGTATDGKLNVVTLGWEVDERGFVEPTPENLLRYSQSLDNGYYTVIRTTTAGDSTDVTDPNGGNTSTRVSETTATGTHTIGVVSAPQRFPIKTGQYRVSLYVKPRGASRYCILETQIISSSYAAQIRFDHTTGEIIATANNDTTGVLTLDDSSAESVGNGWYRLTLVFTTTRNVLAYVPLVFRCLDASQNASYAGNASNGWYLWQAQYSNARNPQVDVKTTDKPVTPFLTNSPVEQKVKASWASPRVLPIRYSASTPTLEEGKFLCSLTAVATGRVKLTFKNAFAQTPIVIATTKTSGNTIDVEEVTNQYVVLRQTNHAGTANDGGAHVLVFGSDSSNGLGRARKSAKCPQIAPRLIAGTAKRIGESGAANLNLQTEQCADLGTVTTTGTGVYVFVFQKPFRRTPVVVANALHTNWEITGAGAAITAVSTTGFTVTCTDTNNTAAHTSLVHVAVLGFDNAQEV